MTTGDREGVPEAKALNGEPGGARLLRELNDWLARIETGALVLMLAVLVGTGVYQTAAAHILGKNETWPYEIIRYSVFFIAMAGAALASARSRMINMDVVTRLLQPKTRAALRIATGLFAVAVCFVLFKGGMDMRDTAAGRNEGYDYISPSTGLLALPIGAVLIGFHFLLHAIIDALWLAGGKVPPEPEHAVH
ncbi:MAG TPA: TRAP transporter small permease [Kofleriaceae bacterium]|nr:TRAP transporter small permease [Kofleriaceae bacterium]